MLVAGNWKMNLDLAAARQLTSGVVSAIGDPSPVDVAICPPFVDLDATFSILHGSGIRMGAQNMHAEESGAFTGEISAAMLRSLGCHYVILGHSERRQIFGESNAGVCKKTIQARKYRLVPIVCVGESLDQRNAGDHELVVESQVRESLMGVAIEASSELVLAYEPVWAIGTGQTASGDQVEEMHGHIRGILEDLFGNAVGAGIAVLYGGSVNPGNAKDLFSREDVDGGLIGGASLNADKFAAIVAAAKSVQ